MSQNRSETIDICKGIGICLVMYAHALEISFLGRSTLIDTAFPQWQAIYSFHMPMFFIISGMLYRRKNLRDVFISSTALLLVASLTHVIGWVAKNIFGGGASVGALLKPLISMDHYSTVVIWFLAALAIIQFIYAVLIASNQIVKIGLILAVIISYGICVKTGSTYFQSGAVLPGLFFYAMGSWANKPKYLHFLNKYRVVGALVALLLVVFLAPLNKGCLFSATQTCNDYMDRFGVMILNGKLGYLPLFILSGVIGCYGLFCIATILAQIGGKLANYFAKVGTHTLDLLMINGFFLNFGQHTLKTIFFVDASVPMAMVLACALTGIQLFFLPAWKLATTPVIFAAKSLAQRLAALTFSR